MSWHLHGLTDMLMSVRLSLQGESMSGLQVEVCPETRISQTLLESIANHFEPRDFAVRFWDGSTWIPEPGQSARFTLILQHPGALRRMFWPPYGTPLAEAYIYDDFDIEGDMYSFFVFVKHLLARHWSVAERLQLAKQLLSLPSVHGRQDGHRAARLRGKKRTLERDRQAISYHYDTSNDFFALWLDKRMVYSCAYFADLEDDIDTAQERKLDYICRKLRLRCDQRLLDIGCGWGGLVLHAARNYGVRALGITLSQKQAELANQRIHEYGLQDRCRVEYRDYREVGETEGFDCAVSVGMLEHLGEAMLPTFFRCAWQVLRPGGVFLNQAITLKAGITYPRWTTFARRYVFPDGEIRPLTSTLRAAELAGFEVRDVESLREHYALTLQRWLHRLEARHLEARQATDEVTYRVFRLYLAGARHAFEAGTYNLHQTLLAKPDHGISGLPLTRAAWYAN
jgi:cyclopropane-fatty-acyl-phospholipid synthase